MNKFLLVAAFVGSVFVSSASAEALFSASNGTVEGGADGACPLLVSDVRVNLSSNVTGAVRHDTPFVLGPATQQEAVSRLLFNAP